MASYYRNCRLVVTEYAVSQTHVLFDYDNKRIISYYSTCNYAIQKSSLKSRFGFPTPQIPATLIGRLAVDKNYKGKGYGGITLAEGFNELDDDKMKLFISISTLASSE